MADTIHLAQIVGGVVNAVIDAPSASYTVPGWTLVQCDLSVGRGWLYDGTNFTAPTPVAPVITTMDPRAFMLLFLPATRTAVESSTDPIIKDFLTQMTAATSIDLNDPTTQTGVNYLVTAGITGMTSANAALILQGQPAQ